MKRSQDHSAPGIPGAGRFLRAVIVLAACLTHTALSADRTAQEERAGRRFESPEAAVSALASATTAADAEALRDVLGPGSEGLQNPDRVQATNELRTFSSALAQAHRLIRVSDSFVILELGDDYWPFPVPIVKTEAGWIFDSEIGKDELLSRRVGRNELAILPVMRAYVDAQREYASRDRDHDGVLEYAPRLVSSPGTQDGLYWPPDLDGEESPFGPLVAYAQEVGYSPELREEDEAERGPFHGYLFKILPGQGKHAPGGRYKYSINGNMIVGFALVAWPAEYGDSGVMTFIVNQQGRVYQKDLGPKTSRLARRMKEYDPDSSWRLSPE
ncbi:MAG: DUF2950 domain-containing protein [Limisphaerales bacterium]